MNATLAYDYMKKFINGRIIIIRTSSMITYIRVGESCYRAYYLKKIENIVYK